MNRALTPISQATLGWPFSFALNRLLDADPEARGRLAPFAGATVELRAAPLPRLRFVILPGGRIEAGIEARTEADIDAPALVITLKPEAAVAWMRGEEHFLRAVEAAGDARLAFEVIGLLRHLRWDAEEDLARLLGDVAGHRLAQLAREFAAWQVDAGRRLAEAVADYAVEERRLLVAGRELSHFSDEVARLRDAVERLDKRMRRLG